MRRTACYDIIGNEIANLNNARNGKKNKKKETKLENGKGRNVPYECVQMVENQLIRKVFYRWTYIDTFGKMWNSVSVQHRM